MEKTGFFGATCAALGGLSFFLSTLSISDIVWRIYWMVREAGIGVVEWRLEVGRGVLVIVLAGVGMWGFYFCVRVRCVCVLRSEIGAFRLVWH